MALSKGTNSFASVEEFDSYFADRLDVAAATDPSVRSTMKAQALITATDILNEQSWAGVAIDVEQPLAFPRSGTYFDPRAGMVVAFNNDIPKRANTACIELAYHLLNNDGLLDDTGNIGEIKAGSISLTGVKPASLIPTKVYNLIQPMLVNRGASSWWRAN